MPRGKFIVLYGANNLGKSTQMDLMEQAWREMGRPYARIKYPIYDSPTGIIINQVLRGGDKGRVEMDDRDFQKLYADNRREFEVILCQMLEEGDVLAEDYVGTGMAWGLTKGVSREELDSFNAGLLEPDIAILLDGERFSSGIEKGHRHECAGSETWELNRRIHRELADECGWAVVNANESAEVVHKNLLEEVSKKW